MTRIAIAGAGIAGLTAALALAAVGIEVTVFDAATRFSEAGAGVQLSPNATRILGGLGLLDAIGQRATWPERVRIRRARDGGDLASLPLGESAARRYGAPFLLAHRADLQTVLLEAVRAHGCITLKTGTGIAGVESGAAGAVAISESGQRFAADGLVGADGLHSQVRRFVAGREEALVYSGRTAWRCLVPSGAAPAHAREAASNLWLGPGAHLVHYPVREGSLVNVVAIIADRSGGRPGSTDWSAEGEPARLIGAFRDWSPEARALLSAAPGWRVWPLYDRPALPCWSRGAVTLAGDAAHPMLPFLAQGAAQAIEDAAALARAVGAAPTFAVAAQLYERARMDRAARVQRDSRRQATIYHLAQPASHVRDAGFRILGSARMLTRYDWLYAA